MHLQYRLPGLFPTGEMSLMTSRAHLGHGISGSSSVFGTCGAEEEEADMATKTYEMGMQIDMGRIRLQINTGARIAACPVGLLVEEREAAQVLHTPVQQKYMERRPYWTKFAKPHK